MSQCRIFLFRLVDLLFSNLNIICIRLQLILSILVAFLVIQLQVHKDWKVIGPNVRKSFDICQLEMF